MSTAPSSAAVAPLLARAWLQFRHECRRQWFFVLLAWAVAAMALAREFSAPPLPSEYYWPATADTRRQLLDELQWWASLILPVWIAGRCIWASRPAALGLAIHARPMGRGALLLGQGAFFAVAVFAPRVVQDAVQVWGFGLSIGTHFAVLAGSALVSLALIGAGAALAALAPTARWFAIAAAAAMGGAVVWTMLVFKEPDAEAWSVSQSICTYWIMLLLFACGACGTWIWKTGAPHRRSALVLLVATLVVVPLTSQWWKWDWRAADPLPYTASKLKPVTAEKGKPLPDGAESLWPSLGIAGLPSGYTASVSSFGSRSPGQSEVHPSLGNYSDFEQVVNYRTYDNREAPGPHRRGLAADMVRSLVHRDPDWTWHDTEQTTRAPIQEIWRGAGAEGATPDSPATWRLGLEIREPRLILELPLRDLLSRHHRVTVTPGVRMDIANMELMRDSLYFHMEVDSRSPGFLPRSQPEGRARGRSSRFASQVSWCAVVLLDDAHRVAYANAVSTVTDFNHGWVLSTDRSKFGTTLPLPGLRRKLTGLTFDEWANHVRVQIWWPEPRGMVELEVPTKEVARLAQPK